LLVAIGSVLILVMLVLAFDIAGAQKAVIKNLTSKSLGTLAPGFAASRIGITLYACLLGSFGLFLSGLGVAQSDARLGGYAAIAGLGCFALLSLAAIVGEVNTYRALKR
jgi:hypothetical protein